MKILRRVQWVECGDLAFEVVCEGDGKPLQVEAIKRKDEEVQALVIDVEDLERIAAALARLRRGAETAGQWVGVCPDHGYYEEKTGQYECPQCRPQPAERVTDVAN
jgi:hypothetical protein